MVPMSKVSATHKLLIICGPTATGKTRLAVTLAKKYCGELVSADSRQVYRGLDIISGKDRHELSDIPMWMYDVASPDEQFSVSLYRKLAISAIQDIHARGKLPILVGGTGLYIRSIIDPPETIDIPPDVISRARWNTMTVVALKQELNAINPKRLLSMNTSDRANPRRLIRALEISAWQKNHINMPIPKSRYDINWIGLERDIYELQKRITARVQNRWDHGALKEEENLPRALSATGIGPIRLYNAEKITADEAKEQWICEEVAYAKRQMTWFRKQQGIHWYDAGTPDLAGEVEKRVAAWYTL